VGVGNGDVVDEVLAGERRHEAQADAGLLDAQEARRLAAQVGAGRRLDDDRGAGDDQVAAEGEAHRAALDADTAEARAHQRAKPEPGERGERDRGEEGEKDDEGESGPAGQPASLEPSGVCIGVARASRLQGAMLRPVPPRSRKTTTSSRLWRVPPGSTEVARGRGVSGSSAGRTGRNRAAPVREPDGTAYPARVAKIREIFVCRACGGTHSKWMGKCPDCGAWDSLEAERIEKGARSDPQRGLAAGWTAQIATGAEIEANGGREAGAVAGAVGGAAVAGAVALGELGQQAGPPRRATGI